jgi:acetyl-CoA carboxylase biotin carboxyl carrier protein
MNDKTDKGAMQIDVNLVRELAGLLDSTHLTEIEVEDGDRKIRVARKVQVAAAAPVYAPAPAAQPVAVSAAPAGDPAPAASVGNAVKSPMVGTAYLAAEPGAAPFIHVGHQVKAGDTLAHRRGDEGDEPDHRALGRYREGDFGRERPAGRIRSAAGRHRVRPRHGHRETVDRQSRRDRAAHPPRLP